MGITIVFAEDIFVLYASPHIGVNSAPFYGVLHGVIMTVLDEQSRLIVVVDDDPAIVESLAMVLEAWGFDTMIALTLDGLRDNLLDTPRQPGLVISDYFLPNGRTGAEAVALVRQHCGRAVPAIILTGDTTTERQAEATAAGCHLLHKPVLPPALRAMVEELFKK